jgi:hypothetical protein
MSDEIRVSRPQDQDRPEDSSTGNARSGGNASRLPWIILALVVIVLVVMGALFRDKLFSGEDKGKTAAVAGNPSGYQAVFLTNGQVYFGKLSDVSDQYVTVKDIYYLQVTQPPLQGSQQSGTPVQPAGQAPSNQQAQLSLVKLGQELHGPVDEMKINRDQILFFEDMKEDGKVMQAIREYQKNPPANGQTPAR